jgi:hypothetical protein
VGVASILLIERSAALMLVIHFANCNSSCSPFFIILSRSAALKENRTVNRIEIGENEGSRGAIGF